MSARPFKLGFLFRCFAAMTLLAWASAMAVCQKECACPSGVEARERIACACSSHSASDQPAGRNSKPAHGDDCGVCLSLKSTLFGGSACLLTPPKCHPLSSSAPLLCALDPAALHPNTRFSRQRQTNDWVFTPEVSLGPAFRALAPPALL